MRPLGITPSSTHQQKPLLAMLAALIALVGLTGCPKAVTAPVPPPITVTPPAPPANADWTLDYSWQESVANSPLCTTVVNTSCIKSFSWGYSVGTTQTIVKTTSLPYAACPATMPSPPDISCQTPASAAGIVSFSDTANTLLPLGGTGSTPFVVANWIDMNGAAQVTAPATAPNLIESAPAATNVASLAHQ